MYRSCDGNCLLLSLSIVSFQQLRFRVTLGFDFPPISDFDKVSNSVFVFQLNKTRVNSVSFDVVIACSLVLMWILFICLAFVDL